MVGVVSQLSDLMKGVVSQLSGGVVVEIRRTNRLVVPQVYSATMGFSELSDSSYNRACFRHAPIIGIWWFLKFFPRPRVFNING